MIMENVTFFDISTDIKNAEFTDEGYLHVPAKVGRTGVMVYYKGDGMLDHITAFDSLPIGEPIPILREDVEVFNPESLKSYRYKPVTNGHPKIGLVDSDTVQKYQVGMTKGVVKRAADTIKVDLVVTDKATIKDVQTGKRQISCGYTSDIKTEPGKDPVFGEYKGTQTNIVCNHIAIVESGRAGTQVRIGDASSKRKENKQMSEKEIMNLHRREFGGLTVTFSDQGAEVFDAMNARVKKAESARDKYKSELADMTAERDKIKGKLDAAKEKASDMVALDAAVAERSELIANAKRLNPDIETNGKTNAAIMKDAVSKVSKVDLEGKSEDYIAGAFESAITDAEKDANRKANSGDDTGPANIIDEARAKFIKEKSGRVFA